VTLGNELADRRYRLADLVESIPVPAAVAFDRDASAVSVNAALAEMQGVEFHYEVDGARLPAADAPLARAARGEHVRAMSLDIVRSDGARRHLSGYASPLFDDDGRPCGSLCVFHDAGSPSGGARDARPAARTSELFAHLGGVLSESLGLQATVDAAMSVVAPEHADWGFVNLLDEAGNLSVAATYHHDPAKHAVLARQIGEVFARLESEGRSPAALRLGEPVVYGADGFEEAARSVEPGVLDAFWEVGIGSMLALPLVVRGALRGTLNVVMFESDRRFADGDVPFFQEVARRLAPAIANAELYERERRVARSFQDAALPASLPSVPGFSFSAIYEAGRVDAKIGGDWYDAFRLGDGRIVISIGDVAGSGLRAAVTMSSVRQAIRGVAQVYADPALMLEAADRTLRAETPDRFVTAFVGVIDGVARTLSYASAGHPPPLVRAGDGSITELTFGDLPLGLREDVRGGRHSIALPDDALLVFYTDGLIESTQDVEDGERRLRAALAEPHVARAANPALALRDAVLVDRSRDDVAILTVAVLGAAEAPA
jgi:hypothetical protein